MKRIVCGVACILISGMLLDLFAQTENRKCTIKTLIGSVKVRKGSTVNWFDARPKMVIKERDAIRTFIESDVELETSEGTTLKIGENTAVEMAVFLEKGDLQNTKIKIMNGSLICNVKKLVNNKSTFTFETPTATASIRGTIVGFDVTKEKTLIRVYEGTVAVTGEGSRDLAILKNNQMVSVTKGQKTIVVQALDESKARSEFKSDDEIKIDSSSIDTSKTPKDTITNKQTGDASGKETAAHELRLSVTSPTDRQVFTKTIIPVSGKTTPGAEVRVNSMKLNVSADGVFSGTVAIPNEEGDAVFEFEVSLDGERMQQTKTVFYKPQYRFSVLSPSEMQVVNATIIQIKGEVQPVSSEITANGTRMSVTQNGSFAGMIQIPDEEGNVEIEFEITSSSISRTERRNITYKRPMDNIVPQLQGVLPDIATNSPVTISVVDRTPDEEITFTCEVDGSRTSDVGTSNYPFKVPLENGVHTYVFYAKDKAGNTSQKMTKKIAYLSSNNWTITMRKPVNIEYIDIPPSAPDFGFEPRYTIELSIDKLPDDDMRLIRDITITNQTTGKTVQDKTFTSNYVERDFGLSSRSANVFLIEVTDINGFKKSQKVQVVLR